jgi:hypothetical protein
LTVRFGVIGSCVENADSPDPGGRFEEDPHELRDDDR